MTFHLAQLNIGRFLAPTDDPMIADFMANLDRINALAESTPGFVWRLTGEGNNATDVRAFDDALMAVNLSVWEDLEALGAFVYRSAHRDIMRRRREWFEAMEVYMVLWWVPAGHTPTPAEAIARLEILKANGPTREAFTFRQPFSAPNAGAIAPVLDKCA